MYVITGTVKPLNIWINYLESGYPLLGGLNGIPASIFCGWNGVLCRDVDHTVACWRLIWSTGYCFFQ